MSEWNSFMAVTFDLATMDPIFIILFISVFFFATICCAGIRRNHEPGVQYAKSVASDLFDGATVTIYESPMKLNSFKSANGANYYSYREEVTTLYENFKEVCRKHKDKRYLGKLVTHGDCAEYAWLNYGDVERLVNNVATSLYHLDGIKKGSMVGIYSVNRIEWMLVDHACSSMSAITIPIGYEQTDENIVRICNETGMEIIFTNDANLKKITRLSEQIPTLKKIISFDEVSELAKTISNTPTNGRRQSQRELKIDSFDSYSQDNNHSTDCLERPTIDTWFTICYTSGTTGPPKGVIHTHGNFMAELASVLVLSDHGRMINFNSGIIHLSYLPLNHIFERITQHALIVAGGKCGFTRGDRKKIFDDAKILKPTIFAAVPKVLTTVYDQIMKKVNEKSFFKRIIFKMALWFRIYKYKRGVVEKNSWERSMFSPMIEALGGQVQTVVTGAAALDVTYIEFYQAIFEHCIQGYGQTETCGAVSTCWLQDTTAGHVGGVLPGVQFALMEPENGEDRSGDLELCVRGPILSPGYFKSTGTMRPLTNEDGWYRTGDAATVLDNGAIHIEGRLGDIVKLSNGFFANVSRIATFLEQSDHYTQICVTADSSFNCPVAIVVPRKTVKCRKDFVKAVLAEFATYAKRTDHKKLVFVEIPQIVVIANAPFSVESGELTDSQKLKRKVIHKNYLAVMMKAYQTYLKTV